MQTTAQQKGRTLYSVSWDAEPKQADNNQGQSLLRVAALDSKTGREIWKKEPVRASTMYQSSKQVVVADVLYILATAQQSSIIIALDTKNGQTLWQREETQKNVPYSLNVCAGNMYLLSNNGELKVLHARDGKPLWSYKNTGGPLSLVATTAQIVYVNKIKIPSYEQQRKGLQLLSIVALSAQDGKPLWHKDYQSYTSASFVASEQGVYLIQQSNSVLQSKDTSKPAIVTALDAQNGKERWKLSVNAQPNPQSSIIPGQFMGTLAGKTLYLNDGLSLIALESSTGKQVWRREHTYSKVYMLTEKGIYGFSEDMFDPSKPKRFCALDSGAGKERWCNDTLNPYLFSLAADTDNVFLVDYHQPSAYELSYTINALSKYDGKVVWRKSWQGQAKGEVTVSLFVAMEGQRIEQ